MYVLLVLLVTALACSAGCFAVLYAAAVVGLIRGGVPVGRAVRLLPALPPQPTHLVGQSVVAHAVPRLIRLGRAWRAILRPAASPAGYGPDLPEPPRSLDVRVRLQMGGDLTNPPLLGTLVVPAPRGEIRHWTLVPPEKTGKKTLPLSYLVVQASFSFAMAILILAATPDRNTPSRTDVCIDEGSQVGNVIPLPVGAD